MPMQTIHIFQQSQHLPPIYFLTSCTRHRQESVYRPNGLEDSAQILFVLDGEGVLTCEGMEYTLKKGTAFYLDSTTPHKYSSVRNLTTAWVTFSGSGCEAIQDYIEGRTFLFAQDIPVKKYITQIEQLEQEYFDKRREGILSSMVYSIIFSFFDSLLHPVRSNMDTVIRFLEENFQKRITIPQLAQLNHSSKSTFCKEFKDTFGCTAFEKLTSIRMVNAKHLLQLHPSEKVSTIAAKCGYEDAGYFCKVYKSTYGISPREERHR